MRQAIVTKYFGPTNARGSRIKAKAQAGSVTVYWDHALNSEENHRVAAMAFVKKWGWDEWKNGRWEGGALPDDTGYAFVWVEL